jgi:hypothetical protein
MRLPFRAAVLVVGLSLFALAALGWSLAQVRHPSAEDLLVCCAFAVLAILAEVSATWIPAYKWEISSSIAIYLAALFILGPDLALMVVCGSSLVSELLLRWGSRRDSLSKALAPIAFNVSQTMADRLPVGLCRVLRLLPA